MIKFLNKLFILILILINNISSAKEEILFSVNNNVITTIDLTQRINYLSVLNNFDVNKIDKNNFIDDLISIQLFNEFVTIEELKITNQEILTFYNKLFADREKEIEQSNNINKLTKEIILNNIRYDLQRKKVIEGILNERINNIIIKDNNYNIIDIFNLQLNYFIIPKEYKKIITNNYNDLLKNEYSKIKNFLDYSKIEYDYFSRKITNLNRLNEKIKKIILSNKNQFILEETNYYIIGIIEKKLKDDIDLKYSFLQIQTKDNIDFNIIDDQMINCKNVNKIKSDNRLMIKEYTSINLDQLNVNVFQNLQKQNDKIILENNNKKILIFIM